MKKRLRKKKFVGEFDSKQWWINCRFQHELTEDRVDEIREWFSAFANQMGFRVFRASDSSRCAFIIDGSRQYTTPCEEQRRELTLQLQSVPEISDIEDKGLGYL